MGNDLANNLQDVSNSLNICVMHKQAQKIDYISHQQSQMKQNIKRLTKNQERFQEQIAAKNNLILRLQDESFQLEIELLKSQQARLNEIQQNDSKSSIKQSQIDNSGIIDQFKLGLNHSKILQQDQQLPMSLRTFAQQEFAISESNQNIKVYSNLNNLQLVNQEVSFQVQKMQQKELLEKQTHERILLECQQQNRQLKQQISQQKQLQQKQLSNDIVYMINKFLTVNKENSIKLKQECQLTEMERIIIQQQEINLLAIEISKLLSLEHAAIQIKNQYCSNASSETMGDQRKSDNIKHSQ